MITNNKTYDFEKGELLLIDKPHGWTSFQVVKKIRYHIQHSLGKKKIKVGHAGTLDPLATGLLVICTGKFTKKLESFQALEKEYTGIIHLGATTPSFDLETEVDATFPTSHINEESIKSVAESFEGEMDQMPPDFSAKKVDGKRAYDLARKKQVVALKKSRVFIHAFKILHIDLPEVHFNIKCSKGTYIRSIAHDFGLQLKSGAYLQSLCRTKVGNHSLEEAQTIDDFLASLKGQLASK